ncbi:LmbE-like protein [Nostoc sp. NIES-3756]|uniref:PIG-L deacetylase family protein n=1 Tax=Nostoc sp. NIES-3756 TaxID=1751286 RepID=UPI00071F41B0|nr:PIG-L family deacetylase [Nostoc sp. NIES-3756]BAT52537.1 LmbE-like protein [Nostoc sp. NIES-3756]
MKQKLSIKIYLQHLQKLIPLIWLEKAQYIHSWMLYKWLLFGSSKQLSCSEKSIMVFSPHQDDETFGCGGMIAYKRELNIPVAVVFITDGKGSSVDEDGQNQIIQTRQQEAIAALKILGVEVSNIHFLAKPDGKLPELHDEEHQQTIHEITELVNHYQPGEIYVPHQKDCHRDHEATYTLVRTAIQQAYINVEIFQYPVWLFWRAPIFILLKLKDIASAYKFSITSVQDKKKRAIASYASQINSLPRGFISQFLDSHEIYFKS